ncbi:hypothetical protein L484_013400 [Morus notabilis]|uniref:Uncharacterized protein n=1 Tax=Morus notabilis TaxID=981085 RepID=W9QZA3_9ROSA|nr:hypothetical protein L484_013400 [Morus notabilis]
MESSSRVDMLIAVWFEKEKGLSLFIAKGGSPRVLAPIVHASFDLVLWGPDGAYDPMTGNSRKPIAPEISGGNRLILHN